MAECLDEHFGADLSLRELEQGVAGLGEADLASLAEFDNICLERIQDFQPCSHVRMRKSYESTDLIGQREVSNSKIF